jgi:hypothetical protein
VLIFHILPKWDIRCPTYFFRYCSTPFQSIFLLLEKTIVSISTTFCPFSFVTIFDT